LYAREGCHGTGGDDSAARPPDVGSDFPRGVHSDPEGTVKASGLELSDSDLEALRSTEWQDLSDAELKERVSKFF
jgi:hypothetical protein